MGWLSIFRRNKKYSKAGSQPAQRIRVQQDRSEDPEMEKLLDSFMRTCWPSNYGDYSVGVDTHALKELRGPYLEKAKAAIINSLQKSPDANSIIAASAIGMTEAIPLMTKWLNQIRAQKDKSEASVGYSRLAHTLYEWTKDEAYLADLAEAIRASGFGDISGSVAIHEAWDVPLTIDIVSAVWEKLKRGKTSREDASWRDNCQDFLRKKLDNPVGQAFLSSLPETEQQELRSMIVETKNQRIERYSRFEKFVVKRHKREDLNLYGEYVKVGGSPIPGLTLRCILGGHTKEVNSTSWTPGSQRLASAGSDNLVVVWDVEKGDFISIIEGGDIDRSANDWQYLISHVAWSSDSRWIAFGSEEKGVSIWDVKKGTFLVRPKRESKAVRALAWAPDHNSLLYSFSNNTVWIQDVPSGKAQQIFEGYGGSIDSLAWSSDATFIAAGYTDRSSNRDSEGPRHEILLWDVKKKQVVTRVACHFGYIYHIAWMPNQPILAAGSTDNTISIWNMQERRQIASLQSHTSRVTGVSFSAGGALLASTAEIDDLIRGTVRLWRTDTWQEVFIMKELQSAGKALAFHPTLPLLATRCRGNPADRAGNHTSSFIRIWDLDFETFLNNPPFVDEFNRMEAAFTKLQKR